MYINSNENDKSFVLLYRKYYPKIFNFFMRRLYNREQSEDFTSNTFLKIIHSIHKNKNKEIKNFNAWIFKIAKNEIISHLRDINRKKRDIIEEDLSIIINSLNINDSGNINGNFVDYIALKQAMEHLKPVENEIIDLYFFAKLNYTEISEILDIKESTLRSMIHRSLKKLEELMGK
jgi:RNA polymerase sigma-70 factor (ECF subfamily)